MKQQAPCWFVHGMRGKERVHLAVAAFTERSARVKARKRIGPTFAIREIIPITFGQAWVIDHGWRSTADAPTEGRTPQ